MDCGLFLTVGNTLVLSSHQWISAPLPHCKQFNETLVKQLMDIILRIACAFCSWSEPVVMESFSLISRV